MRYAFFLLLALSPIAPASNAAQYLPSIQQRWDASDLVCTGRASSPARTGQTQNIDGSDRDELAAQVAIETCFKGELPAAAEIRVLGYDVMASKDISGGYAYAGPPTGFVSEGRNLLFLRRTQNPDQFEVTVPIFATAIHLADKAPYRSSNEGRRSTRLVVIRELEDALIQFGDADLTYIDYLVGYVGTQDEIAELSKLSLRVPIGLQRDIAVAILSRGQPSVEPVVIALLMDKSAPTWKRENAAGALGEHGTEAALAPLQEIAAQPNTAGEQGTLRLWAVEALDKIRSRLHEPQAPSKSLLSPSQEAMRREF